jgi:hypothetical protein
VYWSSANGDGQDLLADPECFPKLVRAAALFLGQDPNAACERLETALRM